MKVWQQDWMVKWALYCPDKIALKEFETGKTLTYKDLNRLGNRIAHFLCGQLNLAKGDRVAIIAENCLEHFVLFTAAQKTGIILVPINHRLTATEIDYLLVTTAPKWIISDIDYESVVRQTPFAKKETTRVATFEELSPLFDKTLSESGDYGFTINQVEENDPIFILFTSGTTGFPKGALYTHKMLFWNSINTALSLHINSETHAANCMPMFHTGGWNVLASPVLHHGGYVVLTRIFDAKTILNLIEKEKLTIFMGIPTMLKMMAKEPAFIKTDYSSLHYFIVGGEPLPVPLIEKWSAQGVAIRQGYGLTEVGPNLTSLHQKDALRKKGSIGRPNFYVEIKIINTGHNGDLEGKEGELLLKGPMVTTGYWEDQTATKQAIVNEWFHTGDIVRQDEEGYLYVVDRLKNMYISGGENVYPAQVERVLFEHPSVEEVVVVGVKDPKWGEVGKAFVVTKDSKPLAWPVLIDYCKTRLAKFKIPQKFEFVDTLPKNDTGKIDRKLLKTL